MESQSFDGLAESWRAAERTRDFRDCESLPVKLRLHCDPGVVGATHAELQGTDFGMQDRGGNWLEGRAGADSTRVFDVAVVAMRHRDTGRLRFVGPYAQGPAGDEFIYLNWKIDGQPGWVWRIKMPLTPLTWEQVAAADAAGQCLEFDATGRIPHDRVPVVWTPAAV